MKKLLILAIILAIVIPIYIRKRRKFFAQAGLDNDTSRPLKSSLPTSLKDNDKLILIKNVMYSDLKEVLIGFCKSYNKENYQAVLRAIKITGREFAIIFPFDISFEVYCYLLNYIKYPKEFKWEADVTGWTTTKNGDKGVSENSLNKKIMLFIPLEDTDYDNVYFTTSDNIGHKLSFSVGKKKQQFKTPKKYFIEPGVNISEITDNEFEDFK